MHIQILNPEDDVSQLQGIVVVIDVFRAFSTSCYIANKNPKRIIATDSVSRAFSLKEQLGDEAVLVGERQGIKIEGFDYGNSPTEIQESSIKDKTIIHTTTAGTKGLLQQNHIADVICGSFVNAQAIQNYILDQNYQSISLYCTARKRKVIGEEDYYFASYLKNELEKQATDFIQIRKALKIGSGAGFKKGGFAPESDFDYCMALNSFDFILQRIDSVYSNCVELEKINLN